MGMLAPSFFFELQQESPGYSFEELHPVFKRAVRLGLALWALLVDQLEVPRLLSQDGLTLQPGGP